MFYLALKLVIINWILLFTFSHIVKHFLGDKGKIVVGAWGIISVIMSIGLFIWFIVIFPL